MSLIAFNDKDYQFIPIEVLMSSIEVIVMIELLIFI